MINHEHKFIFTRTAKTGSTTLIQMMSDKTCRLNTEGYWDYDPNHYPLYITKKIIDPDIYESYFKFAFVRNPWDRMVSAYFYCRKWHRKRHKLPKLLGQFDTWIVSNRKYPKYSMSQFRFTRGCDFIARVENYREDFNTICDKIGIPQKELPHENKTKHKHYTEYYDDETRQIVAENFAKDIEYFGYEFGS